MELLILKSVLTVLMILVIVFDMTKFIIPNWVNLAVILIYPMALFFFPLDWVSGLLTATGVFFVLFVSYYFKLMGGGDIKYFTACSLWTGWANLLDFFIFTAIGGGVLAIGLLLARPMVFGIYAHAGKVDKLPKIFEDKAPAPYGVAISVAMLILLWMDRLIPVVK